MVMNGFYAHSCAGRQSMNSSSLRWQVILFAIITSLVSVIGQDEIQGEVVAWAEQSRLNAVQSQFIDRFESETEMEFNLHSKVRKWTVCERRLHYKKHKSFVDRWEEQMLPPSTEHPHRPIWADMWLAAEEYAKSAYAIKKEGVRLSCDSVIESAAILEMWELMQNHTLKITRDTPDTVYAEVRQFFVSALKVEMNWLNNHAGEIGIAEEIKWRLENAKKVFAVEPFEVLP